MTGKITTLASALKYLDAKALDVERVTEKMISAYYDLDNALVQLLDPLTFDEIALIEFTNDERECVLVCDTSGLWYKYKTTYKAFTIPFELLSEKAQYFIIKNLPAIMNTLISALEEKFLTNNDLMITINALKNKLLAPTTA